MVVRAHAIYAEFMRFDALKYILNEMHSYVIIIYSN